MEADLREQAHAKMEERLLTGSKKLDLLVCGDTVVVQNKHARPRLAKLRRSCPSTFTLSSSTAAEHRPREIDGSSRRSRRSSPSSPRTRRSSVALPLERLHPALLRSHRNESWLLLLHSQYFGHQNLSNPRHRATYLLNMLNLTSPLNLPSPPNLFISFPASRYLTPSGSLLQHLGHYVRQAPTCRRPRL